MVDRWIDLLPPLRIAPAGSVDVARALAAIRGAVAAGTETSHTRDTTRPPRPRSTTASPSAP